RDGRRWSGAQQAPWRGFGPRQDRRRAEPAAAPGCRQMTLGRSWRALVPQVDAQQGAVDLQIAVVVDEAQLPKLVHEGVNARASRADDLSQRLLTDLRRDRWRRAFLTKIGEEEKRPGQALFAAIEQLVDKILLDADVAGQQMGNEEFAEGGLSMQHADHLSFHHPHDLALCDGLGRRKAQRLSNQAAFAE